MKKIKVNSIIRNKRFFNYNFFPKNRKGFLLAEEVLKIVIALISIILLAYLLFSLYNSNKNSHDLELAEESLDHIFEELNLGSEEIQIYNPEGWVISSWSSVDSDMPLSCSNVGWQSCICACEGSYNIPKISKSESEKCDSVGACLENVNNFKVQNTINGNDIIIRNPPLNLNVDYENKIISEAV